MTLQPHDPTQFVAIKKPARDTEKDPLLTDQQQEECIQAAKRLLRAGQPLNKGPPPVPELKGCRLKLVCVVWPSAGALMMR